MPATPGGALTRSDVEAWVTTHLEAAATHWTSAAGRWEGHFETIHTGMLRPGGTSWEGPAADAAAERSWGDLVKVRGAADALYAAAGHATAGAGDIAWAKRQVLDAIAEAEEAGFTVGQDFSVTDKSWSLLRSAADRQQQAQAFAAEISARVQALATIDQQVATQITGALAPLESLSFPDNHGSSAPAINAVDYHRFKQEPGPADPDDPNRHALYPKRNPYGQYGQGSAGDGKEAEKAALDERQRRTHIPIIRQQVQATHPDVNDPVTGKPQPRYYDGLEPTSNPDEYIGIEAKTHEGVDRTAGQKRFDGAVSREHPAAAILNGRPIRIVGTDLAYPPEGWVPPPSTAAPAPVPGASAGYPGMPEPPKMWKDDGQPLIRPDDRPGMQGGSSNPFPNVGTHISPDELAKSGDPELSNLGKFYQGMFGRDPTDPDSTA